MVPYTNALTAILETIAMASCSSSQMALQFFASHKLCSFVVPQRFYLIIEVAVGGTNGYFPDGMGNKVNVVLNQPLPCARSSL